MGPTGEGPGTLFPPRDLCPGMVTLPNGCGAGCSATYQFPGLGHYPHIGQYLAVLWAALAWLNCVCASRKGVCQGLNGQLREGDADGQHALHPLWGGKSQDSWVLALILGGGMAFSGLEQTGGG